jgi:hypothetical protein
MDARKARLNWRTRLSYWCGSVTHSVLFRIQEASHADKIKSAVVPPPLFLLGFWRSGTTFLHELFCCDQRFGFPSTYACLNPSHFLLSEPWVQNRKVQEQAQRQMDNMLYSWISPQEDEFALLALGAPSAYQALLVPSLMGDPKALLCLRSAEEQTRWTSALKYYLQLLTVQQGKAMVLKSPPHGFRLPLLPALFPQARYVLIERNPYEVFASNLKLWRTLLDMYSLESYQLNDIETFVLEAYVLHEEAVAAGTRLIDPRCWARVHYEDLVADPIGQMARLYAKLDLGDFAVVRSRIEQHVVSVAGYKRNQFRVSPAQKARVDAAWGEYIRAKGYGWPEQHVTVA